MATNNSGNIRFVNAADGFTLGGGTTVRSLGVTGADMTFTGSGTATITFPSSTATLATLALAETLSNKTLTAPKFADLGFLADANGNELLILDTVTSAVNELTLANAATAGNPTITASGGDANVGIDVVLKGTGTFNLKGNATQPGELRLYEDTDLGTNFTAFKVGTQAADISYILPTAQGAASTFLQNDGSGNLSWAAASGGTTVKTLFSSPTGSYPAVTSNSFNTNTRAYVGMSTFPHSITVNAISLTVVAVNVAGTIKLAIFSEDGQTQKFSETTASISTIGKFTHTLASPVSLPAGNYYIALVTQSTTDLNIRVFSSIPSGTLDAPTGKPVTSGYITVTAGVMPTSFNPVSGITQEDARYLAIRLDN